MTKLLLFLHELACYYCDLQIHKHVKLEEAAPENWFEAEMSWFEFSDVPVLHLEFSVL